MPDKSDTRLSGLIERIDRMDGEQCRSILTVFARTLLDRAPRTRKAATVDELELVLSQHEW